VTLKNIDSCAAMLRKNRRLFTALYCLVFFFIVEPVDREISASLCSKMNRQMTVSDFFGRVRLNKGGRASADWRSEIQVCSRKRAEDFLDAKFQIKL